MTEVNTFALSLIMYMIEHSEAEDECIENAKCLVETSTNIYTLINTSMIILLSGMDYLHEQIIEDNLSKEEHDFMINEYISFVKSKLDDKVREL